ncbi:MAG: TetR/AcrR family transcriptional regulator [Aquabacterium sp.]
MTSPIASPDPAQTKTSANRRYGGLSAEERSRQRRDKLLEASIEVFGTLGLRKATMRDICNEARIAERYFSEHFSSASDAYEAAFKQISEQALMVTGVAMAAAPLNTRALSVAGLTAFFSYVKEDPRRAQILLVDASSYWRHVTIKTNPELTRHASAMSHFSRVLYPDLPKSIELELLGGALIGLVLQSCLTWVQNGFKQPVDVAVQHLLFAWDGLDAWFKAEIEKAKLAPPPVAAKRPKAVAKKAPPAAKRA